MAGALRFQVHDKAKTLLGWISAPVEAHVVARHNAIGTGEFTLDSDHDLVPALATPGARAVVQYRPAPGEPWMDLFSGVVQTKRGTGGALVGVRTWTVEDDRRVLWKMLGWPNPAGTITQQGAAGASYRSTGPAETVLKALVTGALNHGFPGISVATNQARGGSITVDIRMLPIADKILPALDQAGLGITLLQTGTSLVLDVYETDAWPTVLTEASGVVVDGDYELTGPTVTRITAGAGGEDEARVFRTRIDTALEAEWGVCLEAFLDARDVAVDDPDLATILDERCDEALAEGAPKATVLAELAETETFRFGSAVRLGTAVTVQLTGGPPVTEVVREVQIDLTPGDGLTVVPRVGHRTDDPVYVLAATTAALAGAVRQLRASR